MKAVTMAGGGGATVTAHLPGPPLPIATYCRHRALPPTVLPLAETRRAGETPGADIAKKEETA